MSIRPAQESRLPAPTAPHAAAVPNVVAPSPEGEKSPFARILQSIGHEATRGEAVMRNAIRATQAGRDLGPAELLALQAGVYRYSEVVDLAAKLVDRASTGVKTVISGQ
jgi:hypothetical protein